jgi:hypothetical protein
MFTAEQLAQFHREDWVRKQLTRKTVRDGDCLIWTGSVNRDGYGLITIDKKRLLLHRVVWEIENDQVIPDGKRIRHTCDVPMCCEKKHLILGTQADNVADMMERGRSLGGGVKGQRWHY